MKNRLRSRIVLALAILAGLGLVTILLCHVSVGPSAAFAQGPPPGAPEGDTETPPPVAPPAPPAASPEGEGQPGVICVEATGETSPTLKILNSQVVVQYQRTVTETRTFGVWVRALEATNVLTTVIVGLADNNGVIVPEGFIKVRSLPDLAKDPMGYVEFEFADESDKQPSPGIYTGTLYISTSDGQAPCVPLILKVVNKRAISPPTLHLNLGDEEKLVVSGVSSWYPSFQRVFPWITLNRTVQMGNASLTMWVDGQETLADVSAITTTVSNGEEEGELVFDSTTFSLEPHQAHTVRITQVKEITHPGSYKGQLSITSPDLDESKTVQVEVRVRDHLGYGLLAVALGVLIPAFVAAWRDEARYQVRWGYWYLLWLRRLSKPEKLWQEHDKLKERLQKLFETAGREMRERSEKTLDTEKQKCWSLVKRKMDEAEELWDLAHELAGIEKDKASAAWCILDTDQKNDIDLVEAAIAVREAWEAKNRSELLITRWKEMSQGVGDKVGRFLKQHTKKGRVWKLVESLWQKLGTFWEKYKPILREVATFFLFVWLVWKSPKANLAFRRAEPPSVGFLLSWFLGALLLGFRLSRCPWVRSIIRPLVRSIIRPLVRSIIGPFFGWFWERLRWARKRLVFLWYQATNIFDWVVLLILWLVGQFMYLIVTILIATALGVTYLKLTDNNTFGSPTDYLGALTWGTVAGQTQKPLSKLFNELLQRLGKTEASGESQTPKTLPSEGGGR